MLGAIWRLLLYRVLGGRLLLGLSILGWIRRQLRGRRDQRLARARYAEDRAAAERPIDGRPSDGLPATPGSGYQPSQGSSQTVHRDPR